MAESASAGYGGVTGSGAMNTTSALPFCFLLLLAPAAWSNEDIPSPPPEPSKVSRKPVEQSDYFKVTCRVYINEDGTAKTVEVLSIKPPMDLKNRGNKKFADSIVESARTWTFNPEKKNGKPVAGYAIVIVDVDLAEPFKIGGSK
jgi:hypothetical protein